MLGYDKYITPTRNNEYKMLGYNEYIIKGLTYWFNLPELRE